MKLKTILDLKQEVDNINEIIDVMEDDYLHLLDDDLWTIDLESKPEFTSDYDVLIVTEVKLTKKYVMRFCEDYGLSLKDYTELENKKYEYLFEMGDDCNKNLSIL